MNSFVCFFCLFVFSTRLIQKRNSLDFIVGLISEPVGAHQSTVASMFTAVDPKRVLNFPAGNFWERAME